MSSILPAYDERPMLPTSYVPSDDRHLPKGVSP